MNILLVASCLARIAATMWCVALWRSRRDARLGLLAILAALLALQSGVSLVGGEGADEATPPDVPAVILALTISALLLFGLAIVGGAPKGPEPGEKAWLVTSKESKALHCFAREVGASLALDHVVRSAIRHVVALIEPDLVLLFRRKDDRLILMGTGPEGSRFNHNHTPVHRVGECLCGLAVRDAVPVYSRDIHDDDRCTWAECKEAGIQSFAALPLRNEGDVIGVLGLAGGSERDFERRGPFLEALAGIIAAAFRNALHHEQAQAGEPGFREPNDSMGNGVGVCDDIAGRVEAEQRRHQQETLLRCIISNIPSAVFWKNTESVYEGCNWAFARAAGLSSPDQVAGRTDYDMPWTHEQADRLRNRDHRVVNEGVSLIHVEETLRHADGTERIVLSSKVPLHDAHGRILGVLGIHTDITDRKEAEEARAKLNEQLHQAQKLEAVGQLAGGMAHDFTSLLQVILSGAEKLRDYVGDEAIHDAYAMIEQACAEATGLARSLLTFSHRLPVEKEPLQLRPVLEESIRWIRRLLPGTIEVTLETGHDSVTILADRTQVQQVLLNLVINARDAMPEGGTLRFALERLDGPLDTMPSPAGQSFTPWARLAISDTGSGIPPEVRDRIFEPFVTTKPRGEGSGLGLTIVREIIRQHGARIEVDSHKGEGTTVAIHWPCIEPETILQESKAPSEHASGRGELILLAEAHRYVREIMASTLQSLGYFVLQAADAAQLLELYRTNRERVRLLVVDADLPRPPGPDWLQQIRTADPLTPAIITTASPEAEHDGVSEGHTVFLRKPFQMSELGRLVCRLINPRQSEDSET
jgi:PAS domain S-box-containing protein